ncbi:MAG: glycosyltransferase [Methanosphaera sp.]|nr:glycosyltransferase [Methanosphaera sp.]
MSKENFLISIIIPIYNVEKYLCRCLDILCKQLADNVELILINDGSTDKCGDICINYSEKYKSIKYINKTNGGVSSARNDGIEIAQGDYITFIDPDDTVSETYIEDIKNTLTQDADLYILKYEKVDGDKVTSCPYVDWELGYTDLVSFYRATTYLYLNQAWVKIFKTEIINKYGIKFNKNLHIAEDICFCLDYLYYVEKVYIAEGIFYYYWQYNNSASHNYKDSNISDLLFLYSKVLDFSEEKSLFDDFSFNQPSDFIAQELEKLIVNKNYSKKKIISEINSSRILDRLKQYKVNGYENIIRLRWLECACMSSNISEIFLRFYLSYIQMIKKNIKDMRRR